MTGTNCDTPLYKVHSFKNGSHPYQVRPSGNIWLLGVGYSNSRYIRVPRGARFGLLKCSKQGTWRMATEAVLRLSTKSEHINISEPHSYGEYFSDTLHRPWQCATNPILDEWLEVDNVSRRDFEGFSIKDFVDEFETQNKPVVITNAAKHWKALVKWPSMFSPNSKGKHQQSMSKLESSLCRVGPVDMKLCDYLQYAGLQNDENPLYLFDCKFCERMPEVQDDYVVPKYFKNDNESEWNERDLFELLGPEKRPDYRWLITGQAKSGSKWHVDPNCTHAWNALVVGTKKWIMFPPNVVPPGVQPSSDGADVTQPISLMEWFLNFYDQIENLPQHQRPVEFIARTGDLVFVPCGWWHCVLNLDNTIAVTQNYISSSNVNNGLRFYRDHKHLISGYAKCAMKDTLYDRLSRELQIQRPVLWEKFLEDEEQRKQIEDEKQKKRESQVSWSAVTKRQKNNEKFTFSFSVNS